MRDRCVRRGDDDTRWNPMRRRSTTGVRGPSAFGFRRRRRRRRRRLRRRGYDGDESWARTTIWWWPPRRATWTPSRRYSCRKPKERVRWPGTNVKKPTSRTYTTYMCFLSPRERGGGPIRIRARQAVRKTKNSDRKSPFAAFSPSPPRPSSTGKRACPGRPSRIELPGTGRPNVVCPSLWRVPIKHQITRTRRSPRGRD